MTSTYERRKMEIGADGFVLVAEYPLELEEENADRAEFIIPTDKLLVLRGRENRIGIAARMPVTTVAGNVPPDRVAYDIALMLALHAHPECRFTWSRLIVDLSPTPGAIIEDMSPSKVEGVPVEVQTKVGAGLQFSAPLNAVSLQVNPEMTRTRTVRFPTVLTSGKWTPKAYWDFRASGDDNLHVNQELRLLVTAPVDEPVAVSFTISTKVRLLGVPRLFSLRAKKETINSEVTLVSA
jgi:hypothetical protein